MFRIGPALNAARGSQERVRRALGLATVFAASVTLLGSVSISPGAPIASAAQTIRADTDSVATPNSSQMPRAAGTVCGVRDELWTGCRPGLRRGSTTYSALIIRPLERPIPRPSPPMQPHSWKLLPLR